MLLFVQLGIVAHLISFSCTDASLYRCYSFVDKNDDPGFFMIFMSA